MKVVASIQFEIPDEKMDPGLTDREIIAHFLALHPEIRLDGIIVNTVLWIDKDFRNNIVARASDGTVYVHGVGWIRRPDDYVLGGGQEDQEGLSADPPSSVGDYDGLCVECGKNPPAPDNWRCESCIADYVEDNNPPEGEKDNDTLEVSEYS